MPQMSPMWWTTLYMMFNMTLLLLTINTYFQLYYKNQNSKPQKNNKTKKNKWLW